MSESHTKNQEFDHKEKGQIHSYIPSEEEEKAMWKRLFPTEDMPPHERHAGDMTICLALGDKKLLLYTMDDQEYDVLLVKSDGERIPGATTRLFQEANQIMQQHTNQTRRLHFCDFATKDRKMIAWAESSGRAIFHWDKIQPANKNTGAVFIFSKIYRPHHDE